MSKKGVVHYWNDAKGYGFIKASHGNRSDDVSFVHVSNVTNSLRLKVDDKVHYDVAWDEKKKTLASHELLFGFLPNLRSKSKESKLSCYNSFHGFSNIIL